jgi:hypothetical protein
MVSTARSVNGRRAQLLAVAGVCFVAGVVPAHSALHDVVSLRLAPVLSARSLPREDTVLLLSSHSLDEAAHVLAIVTKATSAEIVVDVARLPECSGKRTKTHARTHRCTIGCKDARTDSQMQATHACTHTWAHARVYATHECTQMRTQVCACVRACVRACMCSAVEGLVRWRGPRRTPSATSVAASARSRSGAFVRAADGQLLARSLASAVTSRCAVCCPLPPPLAPFCALSRTCASHLCAHGHARSTPTRARGSPGQRRRRTRPSVAGECSTRARPAAGAQPMRASCRSC